MTDREPNGRRPEQPQRQQQPQRQDRQDERARQDGRGRQDGQGRQDRQGGQGIGDRAQDPPVRQMRPGQPQQPHASVESGQEAQPRGPLIGEYAPPYVHRSGQVAAVLLYKKGGYSVLWPDRREDFDKPWMGSPYTVFEVRLGWYLTSFDLRLPASGDAAFFDATARVRWEVVDPRTVVRQNVRDVGELLRDELLAALRNVSRRFRLTESQRADDAVRAAVEAGHIDLGRELGLSTRVHVFIDLSEDVKTRVHEKDTIAIDMDTDGLKAEAERRNAARRREALREEAAELLHMLRQGDDSEIAYHMATNPDKQWEIRQAIREERREGQADFIGLFHKLLDTGNLERHDIGEHMYEVLQYLRENSGGVLGGVTESVLPPPRRGGPGRALGRAGGQGRGSGGGRELESGGGRGERAEPGRPYWEEDGPDSGSGAQPPGRQRHVHEPTRVDSSADLELERDRGRDREQNRNRNRDEETGRERNRGRTAERGRGQDPDVDWRDGWDNDAYAQGSSGRGGGSGGSWGDDGRERGGEQAGRGGGGRASRPSADFDDWDDE
ncbi:hypothetical protein [Streptomyces sp. NPDC048442]|uniref:hypothetical protein n=1 Tax=Streptomyces sp. NPDC048442 TaxID=3154823 RepID=UPI003433CA56